MSGHENDRYQGGNIAAAGADPAARQGFVESAEGARETNPVDIGTSVPEWALVETFQPQYPLGEITVTLYLTGNVGTLGSPKVRLKHQLLTLSEIASEVELVDALLDPCNPPFSLLPAPWTKKTLTGTPTVDNENAHVVWVQYDGVDHVIWAADPCVSGLPGDLAQALPRGGRPGGTELFEFPPDPFNAGDPISGGCLAGETFQVTDLYHFPYPRFEINNWVPTLEEIATVENLTQSDTITVPSGIGAHAGCYKLGSDNNVYGVFEGGGVVDVSGVIKDSDGVGQDWRFGDTIEIVARKL